MVKKSLRGIVISWPFAISNRANFGRAYPPSQVLQVSTPHWKPYGDHGPLWADGNFIFMPESRATDWLLDMKLLVQMVEFHFSDGTTILLDEAMAYHQQNPEVEFNEFLPDRFDPEESPLADPLTELFSDLFSLVSEHQRSRVHRTIAWKVLSLLRAAARKAIQFPNEFFLYLTDNQNRQQQRQVFEVRHISFQKVTNINVEVLLNFNFGREAKGEFIFSVPQNIDDILTSPGLSYIVDDEKIVFNNAISLFYTFQRRTVANSPLQYLHWRNQQIAQGRTHFSFLVYGQGKLRSVVKEALAESEKLEGLSAPSQRGAPTHPSQKFTPSNMATRRSEIDSLVRTSGRVNVHLKYPRYRLTHYNFHLSFSKNAKMTVAASCEVEGQEIIAYNLPPICSFLLENLASGMGALSHFQNKDLAAKRKGITRDLDLKVLRHGGMMCTLVLEAINYKLGYPSSDGSQFTSEKEFNRHIFELLGRILHNSTSQLANQKVSDQHNLSKWVSGRVKSLINEAITLVHEMIDSDLFEFYSPLGEVSLVESGRRMAELLRNWLMILLNQSQGRLLLKQKDQFLGLFSSRFQNQHNYCVYSSNHQQPDIKELNAQRSLDLHLQNESGEKLPQIDWIDWAEILTPEELVSLHMDLAEKGYQISLDGKTIDEIEEHDIDARFEMTQNQNIDWFELHPKVFFKGEEIPLEQLKGIGSQGILEFHGKYYRIPGKILPKVKSLEKFWSKLLSHTTSSKLYREVKYYQIPRSQTLEMLALRANGVHFQGNSEWAEICAFYDDLGNLKKQNPLNIPDELNNLLKPYQRQGVQWLTDLYNLQLGGILADDMGLGKTVQALAFLESLRIQNKLGTTLVVVPTSLMYNWQAESQKFTPQIELRLWRTHEKPQLATWLQAPTLSPSSQQTGKVLVVTYSLLVEHLTFFEAFVWNVIIFDEAQNLKNISAQRTTAARKLQGRFKICLSGTPFENNFGEYFSLIDLVLPGSLGSLGEFNSIYGRDTVLPEDVAFLRLKTKPLVLRRTKKQVLLDLPEKTESIHRIPFSDQQKQIYRNIAASHSSQIQELISVQGESRSQLQMLTALLRLRQACSDPSALPNVKYSEIPPKISLLMESIKEHVENGESILVFTQFIATLNRICSLLQESKIKYLNLFGQTSQQKRQEILETFNTSVEPVVLVMTLKTGGVGLNLTKASVVYHIEPWWNPAVENQATDRVHRLGQDKDVTVYRLIMKDSLEEKIELLKARKEAQFNMIFNCEEVGELNDLRQHISKEDFEYLLAYTNLN